MVIDYDDIERRARALHDKMQSDWPRFVRLSWEELFPHTRNVLMNRVLTEQEQVLLSCVPSE